MAAQTAQDLQALVCRKVGLARRVALLSSEVTLAKALEANGCTLLIDPESATEIEAFVPDCVVAFDGFGIDFTMVSRAAPSAELVFSFANAASASRLVAQLVGTPLGSSFAEPEVRRQLAHAGYAVASRDMVLTPHAPSGLAVETEVALRQLCEQLNPDAGVDRFLFTARRGAIASVPEREDGLTSVIVSAGDDLAALEGTLSSLARQLQRPVEVLVVSPLGDAAVDALLMKVKSRAGLNALHFSLVGTDAGARWNLGLRHAQGRYVTCVSAGDLFEPGHLKSLVKSLVEGTRAWSVAGAPVGTVGLLKGALSASQWVFDRERVATFPLQFAEGVEGAEALLAARVASLFEPAFTGGATVDLGVPARAMPEALAESMKGRPLRVLQTLGELLRELPPPPAPPLPSIRSQLMGRISRALEAAEAERKK